MQSSPVKTPQCINWTLDGDLLSSRPLELDDKEGLSFHYSPGFFRARNALEMRRSSPRTLPTSFKPLCVVGWANVRFRRNEDPGSLGPNNGHALGDIPALAPPVEDISLGTPSYEYGNSTLPQYQAISSVQVWNAVISLSTSFLGFYCCYGFTSDDVRIVWSHTLKYLRS